MPGSYKDTEVGPTVHATFSARASERCPAHRSKPHSRERTCPAQADDVRLIGTGSPAQPARAEGNAPGLGSHWPSARADTRSTTFWVMRFFPYRKWAVGAFSKRVFSGGVCEVQGAASDPLLQSGIKGRGRGRPSPARGSRGPGGGDLRPGSGHVQGPALARLVTSPVRLTSRRSSWREDGCSSGKVTAETRTPEAPFDAAPLGQRHVLRGLDTGSGPREPEERCASP